jgi:DUF4097 and DUF4098 domain-containing protein YvlB
MPTFDTPEPIAATIEIPTGHLLIRASDRTDTVVEVRPQDESRTLDVEAAEQTRVEFTGGQLTVKAPKVGLRSLIGRYPSVDVTIDLPADSSVDAKTVANIRTEGLLGESTLETGAGTVRVDQTGRLRVRSGAGDISIGRSAGPVDVATSTGKIRIGEVEGTAVVKTSNGDISMGEVTGDARLNTANGDITVGRALSAIAAKTAAGSVRVDEVVRGTVVLETGFGELELGIREGTAAWLDVNSGHGSVRSELGATDGPDESDETVEVRGRTGYGDIVIRRPRSTRTTSI